MMKKQDLLEKKLHIERFRQSSSLSPLHAQQIQQSILKSWQRSQIAEIPVDRQAAPLNSSLTHTARRFGLTDELCKTAQKI